MSKSRFAAAAAALAIVGAGILTPSAAMAAETVSVDTALRCVAGKATLTAKVSNGETAPLSAKIDTAYGSKTIALAAGTSASAAFSTRAASIPAGDVDVTYSATVFGVTITKTVSASYDAFSCR